MLIFDPEKRISAASALNHDYFKTLPYPREDALGKADAMMPYKGRQVVPLDQVALEAGKPTRP